MYSDKFNRDAVVYSMLDAVEAVVKRADPKASIVDDMHGIIVTCKYGVSRYLGHIFKNVTVASIGHGMARVVVPFNLDKKGKPMARDIRNRQTAYKKQTLEVWCPSPGNYCGQIIGQGHTEYGNNRADVLKALKVQVNDNLAVKP